MKKETTTAPDVTTTNSAQNASAHTSSNACESFPLSSAERADIRNRVDALLKRFMERKSPAAAPPGETGCEGAATGQPACRRGSSELAREAITLDGMNTPAFADPIEAAGNLSGSDRPSRGPTGEPPIGAKPDLNSDGGEKRIIMPRTSRGPT